MAAPHPAPNRGQRAVQKFVAIEPVTEFFAGFIHNLDRFVLQLTGERFSPTAVLIGMPVATVTMTGARSGRERSLPLVCFHDGEKRVLIATNFGAKTNPAWYYNLRANPQVWVSENNKQGSYTARQASTDEREKYWRDAVESYPGYKDYQERAGDRLIPIMVLEPDRTCG